MRTGISYYGIPSFSMALKQEGRKVSVRMSVGMTEFGMGPVELFPGGYAEIDPEAALLFLTAHWPALTGPYSDSGVSTAEVNLRGLTLSSDQAAVLKRDGVYIGFDTIRPRNDLGSHSVVVVECLLRLGEILSDQVENENLVAAWSKAQRRTQLLPMARETIFDAVVKDEPVEQSGLLDLKTFTELGAANDDFIRETVWLAAQLRQTPEHYVGSAFWLHAKNIIAATSDIPHALTAEDWDATRIVADLPPFQEILETVQLAATSIDMSVETVARDALSDRNSTARQFAVYRRWFGNAPVNRLEHHACLVTSDFAGTLLAFDADSALGEIECQHNKQTTIKAMTPEVSEALLPLIGREVTVSGTATFLTSQEAPGSINVSKATVNRQREQTRRLTDRLTRGR